MQLAAGPDIAKSASQGMKGVAESMARGGYCIKTEIVPAADEVAASGELRFTLRLVGPANLWVRTTLDPRPACSVDPQWAKQLPLTTSPSGPELTACRSSAATGCWRCPSCSLQRSIAAQGMTNLSGKRLPLLNDYVGFAEKSFLRASGRTGQYKTSITDVGLEQTWVVK